MITKFTPSQFTNAQHVAFHHAVQRQLEDFSYEDILLSQALFQDYKRTIEQLQDCTNRTFGSEHTERIHHYDELRTRYFIAVRHGLQNALYSSRTEISNLYPIIKVKLLKPYPGSTISLPAQKKSGTIRGFIEDIENFLTTSQIERLGIKTDLAALGKANDSFESTSLARIEELSQMSTGVTLRNRAKADFLYSLICLSVNYTSLLADSEDEDIAMAAQFAQSYQAQLNQLIADFKASSSSPKGDDTPGDNQGGDGNQPDGNQPSGDNGNNGSNNNNGNSGQDNPGAMPGDL